MRRVIVDFKKLNKDILDLLVTKYPDGYDDDDIITFKNTLNEIVECVEVRTDDTVYLVKAVNVWSRPWRIMTWKTLTL